jgi:thiol-disulfide isomerase/thioredoxin
MQRLILLVLLAFGAFLILVSPADAASAAPTLSGHSLTGEPFDLQARRGKVVMLFFWNTDCVPCIQKMPELRANAMGWRSKPFELVLISTDRERAQTLRYLQTVRGIEKNGPQATTLWWGDLRSDDATLTRIGVPLTLVIDAQGRLAARHAGRIAPEAWDDVAGLLP